MKNLKIFLSLFLLVAFTVQEASAQYFGQNKPRYRTFDFEVLNTPNFEIHHYLVNRPYLESIADQTEQWFEMHSSIFTRPFPGKNPIIFYNNHPEFQQTNTIHGHIGVGTGGVTEGFKNRVIMPFTMTHQQTNHVLGHELVHAFQYNTILNGDSTSLQSMANIPLWMIEGLAEYLSIGREDSHTAMWMRDAVLHDDVPSIKKLSNYAKYFPYRYGQSFWAFATGLKGDQIIQPLFKLTAMAGLEFAIDSIFGTGIENVSEQYQSAIKTYYEPFLDNKKERKYGKKIISDDNAGRMNISPVMSPNGRYLIFLSEKNLFSTDLYLADARSGKILKKITSLLRDDHLDDLNFLESAGTWSPNSKEFAFIGIEKGRNVIVIKEAQTGRTVQTISIDKIPAISNPAWSPDGKSIVFSGLVQGQTDLYQYILKTGKLNRLTNDPYSEIQPNFNKEGTQLVFASDRISLEEGRTRGKWKMNISVLDLERNKIQDLDLFRGADNLNPGFNDAGEIYFLSDRDGFRNIYKYNPATDSLFQMTDFLTGVSGITKYSPAISVSRSRDRLVFSHYSANTYTVYQASGKRMLNKSVNRDSVAMAAGTLPVTGLEVNTLVQDQIDAMDARNAIPATAFSDSRYKPKFQLDYIGGSTGVGVGTGTFGTRTGLAGGVQMLFGDMLGNNQIFAGLSANGDIQDIGGLVQYLNTKNRLAWGFTVSHLPMRAGGVSYSNDTLEFSGGILPVIREDVTILRIFEDQLKGGVQFPFSKNLRWEANAGVNYRSFRMDVYPNYYDPLTGRFIDQGRRERVDIPDDEITVGGFRVKKGAFYDFNMALVGDNSRFGMTSPLNGYRYRFEVTKYLGEYDFMSGLADIRLYQYKKPVTLAFRAMHLARYGEDRNSFNPILIGQMGLVHGFDYNHLTRIKERHDVDFNQLSGNKFFLTSFEVRLPFTGPERLAVVPTNFLMSDLALFLDVGIAFDDYSQLNGDGDQPQQVWAKSAGLAWRVNLFGAIILEPYVAYPLLSGDTKAIWGVNFIPGW